MSAPGCMGCLVGPTCFRRVSSSASAYWCEELRNLRPEIVQAEGTDLGEAVVHLLAFILDKFGNHNALLSSWDPTTSRMSKILLTRVDFRSELDVSRHPDVLRGAPDCSLSVQAHGPAPLLRLAVAGLRLQATDPQQSVRGADQVGGVFGLRDTAESCRGQATDGVHPPDDLLDAFAEPLTQNVAGAPRRAPIQPGRLAADHRRDIRANAPVPQGPDERPGGSAVIRSQGPRQHAASRVPGQDGPRHLALGRSGGGTDLQIHAQSMAVLHQHMARETPLGVRTAPLAHQAGLGIRRVLGRRVRATPPWKSTSDGPDHRAPGLRGPPWA